MNTKLPDFLQAATLKVFEGGIFDCVFWLADWYIIATERPDPIPEYRGWNDYPKLMDAAGNWPRLVRLMCSRAGLKMTNDPLPGDIGLLRNRPGSEVVGGIKTQLGWAILTVMKQGDRCSISLVSPVLAPNVHVMAAWRLDA